MLQLQAHLISYTIKYKAFFLTWWKAIHYELEPIKNWDKEDELPFVDRNFGEFLYSVIANSL